MGTNTKEYAKEYYQTHKEQMKKTNEKAKNKRKIKESRAFLEANWYFVILDEVFDNFLEKTMDSITINIKWKLFRMTVSLVLFIWLWTVCLYLWSHYC